MKKISIITLLAFLVGVLSFVIYTAPHWWWPVGKAEISFANGSTGTAPVYRSRGGDFLIMIGSDLYIFYPNENLIGVPSSGQFIELPFLKYSKGVPVPTVRSDNRVKMETDMNVKVENKELRFTTFNGERIRFDFSDH